jgi:hypothetical protein
MGHFGLMVPAQAVGAALDQAVRRRRLQQSGERDALVEGLSPLLESERQAC